VACCRRIWQLLPDERSRQAVEVAERYADAQATEEELEAASAAAWAVWDADREPDSAGKGNSDGRDDAFPSGAWLAAYNAAIPPGGAAPAFVAPHEMAREATANSETEGAAQCVLLRDLFGNPFRPVAVDPGWLTPEVVHLAQSIYDDRAFDHLPALADALEEAGWTNADLLNHCRQPGPHVRGCWVLDLVLGKE
jgi:hypothetical protein